MNVLIDALPGIDKDNENPDIHHQIQHLIQEEMKNHPKENDEKYLLSQSLLITEEKLDSLIETIEQKGNQITQPKIINPEDFHLSSLPNGTKKEWEEKVRQLTILYSHSENQLLNLELFENYSSKPYLLFNTTIETTNQYYSQNIKETNRNIYEIQKQRRDLQDKLFPQLIKLETKKMESYRRKLGCDYATQQLKEYLATKGFNYEEYIQEKQMDEEKLQNPNDQRFNSTVREYETVNEVIVEDVSDHLENQGKEVEEVEEVEETPKKKRARRDKK